MSNFINLLSSNSYSYEKQTTKRLLEAQKYLQSRLVVVRSVYVVAQIGYVWYHKKKRQNNFYIQKIKRK